MFKFVRVGLIALGLLFTLFFFNSQIHQMNLIKQDGADVLFKLRTVDPRAFMQGDFMALRYSEESLPQLGDTDPSAGIAIVAVDRRGVGTYVRLDDGTELTDTEMRVKYGAMIRGGVSYGGERYFFQEGTAKTYEAAEYGMFKISPDGRAMLVGLAGEDFEALMPPPNP